MPSAVETTATARSLSAALLRLRLRWPFLAVLALFARYGVTDCMPTDGETGFVNPAFWHPLPLRPHDALPPAEGGTDFRPFFQQLSAQQADPYGPPAWPSTLSTATAPLPPPRWPCPRSGSSRPGAGPGALPFGEAVRLV